ncbi:MAG: Xaa-Pro peptidase family protein, partial [Candidatus Omnitrophota bacterium]|nr:Xaa-Pro peptidase family protein [Candidatus Omnitrophota bacterium]
MNSRLKRLYARLKQEGLEGLVVSSPANISYLAEFRSRDSYSLISEKQNIYFTDSRYILEAGRFLKKSFILKKTDGSVFKRIAQSCLQLGLKRIGFEERALPFAEYKEIKKYLGRKSRLLAVNSLIEELRQLKDPQEIKLINKAVGISISALQYIEKHISAGIKEIEIAGELERYLRYHGAAGSAFEIIVASGANSAFPHHTSSQKRVLKGEPVLIDIGADFQGYKSDLTRVFFLGKINPLLRKVYEIVLRAQQSAIAEVKPGCPIREIDRAARSYITQQGFGPNFSHNLGHGVGLEVHESPQISAKENNQLKPGMVFTVEPAIYL